MLNFRIGNDYAEGGDEDDVENSDSTSPERVVWYRLRGVLSPPPQPPDDDYFEGAGGGPPEEMMHGRGPGLENRRSKVLRRRKEKKKKKSEMGSRFRMHGHVNSERKKL